MLKRLILCVAQVKFCQVLNSSICKWTTQLLWSVICHDVWHQSTKYYVILQISVCFTACITFLKYKRIMNILMHCFMSFLWCLACEKMNSLYPGWTYCMSERSSILAHSCLIKHRDIIRKLYDSMSFPNMHTFQTGKKAFKTDWFLGCATVNCRRSCN